MSEWMRKRRKDRFYRRAKDEGYRSRASYKLLQLHRRYGIFRRGDRVLDLGSAPGGWSQVAAKLVGGEGFVVGVDLAEAAPLPMDNVVFIVGDIMDSTTEELIRSHQEHFDVVLSDASPSISGIWTRDHLLSVDLADRAMVLCGSFLREGGNLVAKVFQGEELDRFHRDVRARFALAKRAKPEASRGGSSEVYIIGKGFRGSMKGSPQPDGFQ